MSEKKVKLVVACVAAASLLLAVTGCVMRSELDAKVAELKNQGQKLTAAEQTVSQLTADLDGVKEAAKKAEEAAAEKSAEAEQAKKILQRDYEIMNGAADKAKSDLQTRIKALEQENADLKAQSEKASQAKAQLQKDLDAAKVAADKAKSDLAAKIKALEQENADLKKPAPKP